MNLLVIDAQGGGIGKQVVAAVKKRLPELAITAIGTNSLATSSMLKAGADNAATGENAVVVGCRTADIRRRKAARRCRAAAQRRRAAAQRR